MKGSTLFESKKCTLIDFKRKEQFSLKRPIEDYGFIFLNTNLLSEIKVYIDYKPFINYTDFKNIFQIFEEKNQILSFFNDIHIFQNFISIEDINEIICEKIAENEKRERYGFEHSIFLCLHSSFGVFLKRFNEKFKFNFQTTDPLQWFYDMQNLREKEYNFLIDHIDEIEIPNDCTIDFFKKLSQYSINSMSPKGSILFSTMHYKSGVGFNIEREKWFEFCKECDRLERLSWDGSVLKIKNSDGYLVLERKNKRDEQFKILSELFDIVYIMKRGDKVKIGKTKNLKDRIRSVSTTSNDTKILSAYLCIKDQNVENLAHRQFHSYRLSGEWFSLSKLPLYMKFLKEKSKLFRIGSNLENITNIGQFININ